MKYRCPKCNGSELKAEVLTVVTLNEDGTTDLESFDSIPGHVSEMIFSAYAKCWVICADCEHEDYLPAFEHDTQPKG